MSSVTSLVAKHPTRTLLPASFALSYLSLSLVPSFIPLVSLLTLLLIYTRGALVDKKHLIPKTSLLWLSLTVSMSLSHLAPSIHALSTPSVSIAFLALLSGMSSAIGLVPIYASHCLGIRGLAQYVVFPSLWAMTWLVVSWISPIGRLITWTPLSGADAYRWIIQLLGFAGLDWIAAAWATVAAEILGNLVLPSQEESILVDVEATQAGPPKAPVIGSKKLTSLTGFLLAFAIPSFFVSPLHRSPVLSATTTPLEVACILPKSSSESPLDRFLVETRSHANLAKILLWPESAVTFETESAKQQAFDEVRKIIMDHGVWIGVSFSERVPASATTTRDGLLRNGVTLLGPGDMEVTYYKRLLVPIAESFSHVASTDAPSVHTIDLPRPKHVPKSEWGPSETRAIPFSASICLDFSAPLTSLDSRPALVLAPAKTWHTGVGLVMYELARARGDEIGADVLWCDGGAGLSGIAGNVQVGGGSWVKTIGVPHPFSPTHRRTVYGVGGDWVALAAILGIPAMIFAAQNQARHIEQTGEIVVAWMTKRKEDATEMIARIRGAPRRQAITPAPESESLI